jgi:hypothetical protein
VSKILRVCDEGPKTTFSRFNTLLSRNFVQELFIKQKACKFFILFDFEVDKSILILLSNKFLTTSFETKVPVKEICQLLVAKILSQFLR